MRDVAKSALGLGVARRVVVQKEHRAPDDRMPESLTKLFLGAGLQVANEIAHNVGGAAAFMAGYIGGNRLAAKQCQGASRTTVALRLGVI